MGEAKRKRIQGEQALHRCTGLQTPGGKIYVRWEESSAGSPGQCRRNPIGRLVEKTIKDTVLRYL